MSPLILLTSNHNTNIFKAPEAMKEVVPEMKMFEDVPEEPETPHMKSTLPWTNVEEEIMSSALKTMFFSNTLHKF